MYPSFSGKAGKMLPIFLFFFYIFFIYFFRSWIIVGVSAPRERCVPHPFIFDFALEKWKKEKKKIYPQKRYVQSFSGFLSIFFFFSFPPNQACFLECYQKMIQRQFDFSAIRISSYVVYLH